MRAFGHFLTVAACAGLFVGASEASASDVLRVAVFGGGASWDSSIPSFGARAGFYHDAGIDLEISATEGGTATLQALIAGSIDIGIIAVPSVIGAAVKGAPIVMIAGYFRGSSDYLWYVKADSPIMSFKDLKPDTKIGYSTPASSSYITLAALLAQYGVKADLVAAGVPAANMIEVMTGQLDVGYDGNAGLGVPQFQSGEVRIIAVGGELVEMQNVTVRGIVVTEDTLQHRRDVLVRFLKATQRAIDWAYADPSAVDWYAGQTHVTADEARRSVERAYPHKSLQIQRISGIDISIAQGLQFKRIARAPTDEELSRIFNVLWTPDQP